MRDCVCVHAREQRSHATWPHCLSRLVLICDAFLLCVAVGDADSAFFPGLAAHLSWGLEPLARTRPDVAVPPQRRPSALNKVLSAAADTADSKGSNDLVLSLVLALRSGHQGRNKTARSKYDAADKVSSATTPHGDVFVVNPLLAPALANESAYYKGSMSLPSLFSQMVSVPPRCCNSLRGSLVDGCTCHVLRCSCNSNADLVC